MPRICYEPKSFTASSLRLIELANEIIAEYAAQGFSLTLRQLYYQLVSRDVIANRQTEYKRLGGIIADARLAGLIDWYAIEDRTRNLQHNSHWSTPREIMQTAVRSYQIDKWEGQQYRPEVWVEKDALSGVVASACEPLDVPYFSCRGYTSASEMWAAGQRFLDYIERNQTPVVIHLGDHDPSGIDMTRDIQERLRLFTSGRVNVTRIALNMEQIAQFNPPPNPAKLTDSRANAYIAEYGDDSWELDALDPATMVRLIEEAILSYRDDLRWYEMLDVERGHKTLLQEAADSLDLE